MTHRILLVEDNETLGYILKEYLEMKGYQVTLAGNGVAGLEQFREGVFDLCLLDVMMPEMDGFTLAEKIRAESPGVPLIFLTAKSLKVDVLKGFNIGADDYIKKPVDEEELVARIRAVLMRSEQQIEPKTIHQIGNYTFDPQNQKLSSGDFEKYLTEMEAKLLEMLVESKGNLVSRQLVLKTIWGKSDYFTRRSMDVFISKLRKYLSHDERILITNVHGSGFILTDG